MDGLELLKRDWRKKSQQLPQLTFDEIHKMIWKRSSSIVKWIFIISIIEFILPQLLYFMPFMADSLAVWTRLGLERFVWVSSIIQYGGVIFFIFQFYKRYREISTLDNAKQLVTNILKTRRTVKHYVTFCLSLIIISFLALAIGIYIHADPMTAMGYSKMEQNMPPEAIKITLVVSVLIIGTLVTAVMGLIYFLLYGILLKKLNKNYKELKNLDA